jgi:hypothetical protein
MCLRFVFLLITRLAAWLRLSRREEAWKTAEILILRLCRAKTRTPALSWYFLQPLGCSPVLADQALDGVPALDPGGHVDRLAGLVQGRSLFPRLVWPVIVVVLGVLGKDLPKVLFAVDQQVVEALTAQRSRIPLREGVRPGRSDRSLDDPHAGAGEYLVEHRRELAVAVADQEFEVAGASAEVHQQVAGLLGGPRAGGVSGDAQTVHPVGAGVCPERKEGLM